MRATVEASEGRGPREIARAGVDRGLRRVARGLLAITLSTLIVGCAAPVAAPELPEAELPPLPTDGYARFHYPQSRQLFAEGRFANGRRIGRWYYFFRDGQPFAMGDFDERGRYTGWWWLWTRSGELSQERRRTRCIDSMLMDCMPGYADLEFDPEGSAEERRLLELSPCLWPSWNGTGVYWQGFWQGSGKPDS